MGVLHSETIRKKWDGKTRRSLEISGKVRAVVEKKFVIVESPFAGDVEANVEYARDCLYDSLLRGEAPFASHLLYTQVLDDELDWEREWGISAGLELAKRADLTAVYTDRGISRGMKLGIKAAEIAGRPVEFRTVTDSPLGRINKTPNENNRIVSKKTTFER